MALKITEEWVRERVELNHDKLDDVRSLSLPGTYHEKITELGSALEGFSRLKHLDLSRNALHSLEGLAQLRMLGKLNLYYNNIATLKELFRLRSNQQLQELDLRLNPVAKNEPDYRLFVVHMLPNLRRLDDRPVRDTERKAAILHFSSEQAVEFAEQILGADATAGRPTQPRAEYTRGLSKYSTALHDDDNEILDLMVRTDWQPGQPVGITGSSAKSADSQDYTRQEKRLMSQQPPDDDDYLLGPVSQPAQGQPAQSATAGQVPSSLPKSILNLSGGSVSRDPGIYQPRDRGRVKFADEVVHSAADPNLQFTDELQAYTKFTSQGVFTPAPDCAQTEERSTVPVSQPPIKSSATESRDQPYYQSQPLPKLYSQSQPTLQSYSQSKSVEQAHSQSQPLMEPSSEQHVAKRQLEQETAGETTVAVDIIRSEFMDQLLTVVDKYWNGSGSLHKNQKFQGLAKNLVTDFVSKCTSKYQHEFQRLNEDMAAFAEENVKLRRRLSSDGEENLRTRLEEEQRSAESVRGRLQQALEEGEVLKKRLFSMETSASSQSQGAEDLRRIGEQNKQLNQEVNSLKLQLVNYKKMQELTSMLQESHKSLVATNEHLLSELEQTRQRHQHEVEQLHWSYDQLKRTAELGSTATSYGQHNGIL
ncbi:PREDICTED: centrosomal protein of 72 kDa-like [Branchiostoma belcheri]|uniref:Centrosomal protein of 72 kDa n=1 Tax=Branchiostoma belcheri TaxID=7741 RepID=A0A6P4Y4F7_BRABE|nr:PREDICTED: centrosomal protein of 72 kDa-like [Branchiostoma belcheri]